MPIGHRWFTIAGLWMATTESELQCKNRIISFDSHSFRAFCGAGLSVGTVAEILDFLRNIRRIAIDEKVIHFFFSVSQEHTMPSIPHKDYLPDITGPDTESDYEPEEEQGGEEEYDDYQDNLHQND